MPKEIIRYSKDNVTVVWKPNLCIHSAVCARGLPTVFNPSKRPLIHMDGAELEAIVALVGKCPSGAFSIEKKD